MAKFSTQMLSALTHGLLLLEVFFFGGILIEAGLTVMGALALYGIPKWTIPIVLGAFGFLDAFSYELSRRLDMPEEEKK